MFNKIRNTILDINAADASISTNPKALGATSAVIVASVASTPMVFAEGKKGIDGLFEAMGKLAKSVYEGTNKIIVGLTVAVIGVGFIIRIVSKNQRTVDEATTWIKRAVLTLIVWKFLGLFMDTIDGAAEGNGYTWK